MKRVLGGLARWLWYLAAVVVVLCAVLVSLGQYYFPYLDNYRAELVARAAERLPFGIEVAGLHAEWTGLAPTFHVEGLRLFAREEPDITILSSSRSDLRIDIVRSLLARAPRIRSIAADDVQLGFREDEDGHWHLAGIGVSRTPADRDAILDFFLAIEEIALERTRIVLSPAHGGQVETQDATVRMQNYRRLRRLDARLRDDAGGGRLDLIVETHGDPRRKGEFDASAWMRLEDVRLARMQPLVGAALRLPRTALGGELWASLEADGDWSLRGDLRTPALELAPLASGRSLEPVRGMDARFVLRHEDGTSTLDLDHLTANWYAQDVDIRHLRFQHRGLAGGADEVLAAEYLDVGALAGIATGSGLVQGPWADALLDLSPYGGLADAHVDIQRREGQPLQFRLRGRLEDLSVSPWRSAPGVRNARGYVELGRDGGHVDLDTGAITLEFPRLYEDDIDVDALRGRVRWNRGADGLVVESELLEFHQEQSRFSARFGLHLNRDPAVEDEFTLAASVRNADVSLHEKLVPYTVSKGLRRWLEGAITSGRVDAGSFAYRGAFGRPDGSRSNSVQLALEVSEAAVDYHPDWPPASGVHAFVQVDGPRTRVQADAGEVLGARLRDTLVDVDLRGTRRLRVTGGVEADLGQALALVNGSPLASITRGGLRDWGGSGPASIDLDLDIPLGERIRRENARIGVRALLSACSLELGGLGVELAQISGPLGYSLDGGLRSAGLSGTLWERPFTARIGPLENAPGKMLIEAQGQAAAADVERWLDVSTGGMLSGETSFSLRLEQREQGFATRVRSDLAGVASGLPEPLGKAPEATLPFSLDWEPGADGARISAALDGLGALAVLRAPGASPAGEIVLGAGAPPVSGGVGLALRGDVPRADAGAWIVAASRLVALNAGRGREGDGFRIDGLRAASARLLRPDLVGLELRSRREDGTLAIGFGADLLAGEFRIPADRSQPFALHLERLDLASFLPPKRPEPQASQPSEAAVEPPPAAADTDPWNALADARVPPIDVSIAALRSGPRDMGAWRFRVASETDALALSAATGSLPGLHVGGTGDAPGANLRLRWIAGVPRTELSAGLRFDNPGKFFRNWGYDPVLEGNEGRADVSLSWPGNPLALRMADARGLLDFEFTNGRLLRGGGNNPLMRAFGVLRFDELLRRLKLDFKDLYQSGLAFDTFQAVIDIADGTARTSEPMELRGPTARMRLGGQSDLRRNLIDADLVVSLPLGSNLPWVAVLAGGLPAVAGAYLASRIFEDELGKFSSAVYTVKGSLEEPELKLVKVFDLESTPSSPKPGAAAPAPPGATAPATPAPSGAPAPGEPP